MKELAIIVLSYLLGSIPFGTLVSKVKGVNLRKAGSGNIGATNVLRSVGKLPALFVLLADALKGTFAVLLARRFLEAGELWEAGAGLAAIAGHLASVYLGFKGGKGVSTGLGVFFAINPLTGFISILIWLSVAVFTRYSSLAAIVTFLCLPVVVLILTSSVILTCLAIVVTTLIIFKHIDNIQRLVAGIETRIGKKAKSEGPSI
jgi:glycerol-3-phosphate acyltransferase PlsY